MKNLRLHILLISIFFLSVPALASESTFPPKYPSRDFPSPSLATPPVTSLSMGNFVVNFNSTTLKEVAKTTKKGAIKEKGDASESVEWICYTVGGQDTSVRLWLMSGEIDGEAVGAVAVKAIESTEPVPKSCPELPDKFKPVKFDNGLWIQKTEKELTQKLGKPSLRKSGWLHYSYEKTIKNDPRAKDWGSKDWHTFGDFSARIRAGKIVEIWASKQEGG